MSLPTQTILAVSLFFHVLATIVWIGGLAFNLVFVLPEVRRVLGDESQVAAVADRLRKRFTPFINLSLAVLIFTGLVQMAGDENYDGLMQITNDWSRVILVKHLLLIAIIGLGALLQFGTAPALERASLLASKGKGDPDQIARLRRRESRLTWASVILGVAVVALSVWASVL